jgi:hypothetical protein
MVTHRTANFIMLISNLPSVRSSRFKPNVGNRVIRLSLSFPFCLFFSFYSHTMSFFCQIRSSTLVSRICTATKTTTTTMTIEDYKLLLRIFFSFLHIDTYIHSIYSFTLRWKKKKRVAPLPLRQLNSCIFFPSLFYSSLQ